MTLCPPRRLPRCTLPGGYCMTWQRRGDSVLWTAQIRPGKALPVRPHGWLPDDGGPCRSTAPTCPGVAAVARTHSLAIDAAEWLSWLED